MTRDARKRTLVAIGFVVLTFVLLFPYGLGLGLNPMELRWLPGFFLLNFFILVAVLALPVLSVMWLVESRGNKQPSKKPPLQIAEERYARGEIDRQQFEEIREVLARR